MHSFITIIIFNNQFLYINIYIFIIYNMLYIGYPVSFKTACKILNFKYDSEDYQLYNKMKTHLAKHDLILDYYDKGIYILGMYINELCVRYDNYSNADQAVDVIIYYKKKVIDSFKAIDADLSEFDIEIMEEEPKRVYNPEPYILS